MSIKESIELINKLTNAVKNGDIIEQSKYEIELLHMIEEPSRYQIAKEVCGEFIETIPHDELILFMKFGGIKLSEWLEEKIAINAK